MAAEKMQWLWDLFCFWFKCFVGGVNLALAIVLWADGLVTVILAAILGHKGLGLWWASKTARLSWQDVVMRLSCQIGALVFCVSFLIVNPFLQYKGRTEENSRLSQQWLTFSNDLFTVRSDLAACKDARLKGLEDSRHIGVGAFDEMDAVSKINLAERALGTTSGDLPSDLYRALISIDKNTKNPITKEHATNLLSLCAARSDSIAKRQLDGYRNSIVSSVAHSTGFKANTNFPVVHFHAMEMYFGNPVEHWAYPSNYLPLLRSGDPRAIATAIKTLSDVTGIGFRFLEKENAEKWCEAHPDRF